MNLFAIILRPLELSGLEYMVSGSVAAMTYGQPRLTNDIDLILSLPASALSRFEEAFPESDFYREPTEVLS